jgi:hypothetical protein
MYINTESPEFICSLPLYVCVCVMSTLNVNTCDEHMMVVVVVVAVTRIGCTQ